MSNKIIILGKEYDKDFIDQRSKELAEKYKDQSYWKLTDKEEFVWQWNGEAYVPEYSDKQF